MVAPAFAGQPYSDTVTRRLTLPNALTCVHRRRIQYGRVLRRVNINIILYFI